MPDLLPFEKRRPQILHKYACHTNPLLGCPPAERTLEQFLDYAVVNLDKPAGPTSRAAADMLNRALCVKKSGHSGTLDPAVTGVLPIAIGRATRVIQTILSAGKEYICTMDVHRRVRPETITEVLAGFVGEITQTPPVRSRVKRDPRKRTVYYLTVLEIHGRVVKFRVGCQAGTYIRKLVHDIGQTLKTGAHMAELRRTKAGPFDESNLCTLDQIADAHRAWDDHGDPEPLRRCLIEPERAVAHLPKIWIDDTVVEPMSFGAALAVPGICKCDDDIQSNATTAVMTLKDELTALGKAQMTSKEMIENKKGIALKTKKVFIPNGLYKPSKDRC